MSDIQAVYADESGSTGENLLDPAQPVFVTAAVHLDDDVANSILGRLVAALPGWGEPKYTSLIRSSAGRAALVEALIAVPPDSVYSYPVDKRFMTAAKMVDLLIEPMMFKAGYNMYADGSAKAMAHLLHVTGPVLGDRPLYDDMLSAFARTVRKNSTQTVEELYDAITAYIDSTNARLSPVAELLVASRAEADELVQEIAVGMYDDLLEPAIPAVPAICFAVASRIGPFRLVHDNLKPLARHSVEIIQQHLLPDPARPGDRLPPLPITSMEFSDSTTHAQLQLADWVAGATRQVLSRKIDDKPDALADTVGPIVLPWVVDALWPSPDATGPQPPTQQPD